MPDTVLRDAERTPCECWTRVMGYHRPVSGWNPGKQSEFAERRYFEEMKAVEKVVDALCWPTGPAGLDEE